MTPAKRIIPALLLVGACGTVEVGREFDFRAFDSSVQHGISTRADVRGWLGAPAGVGVSVESGGERYEQWTYYHGEAGWPALAQAHVKVLQIKFDERGVVRAYNWSGESSR